MRTRSTGLVFLAGAIVLASVATATAVVPAEDILISGKKIVVKDDVDAAKRKATAVSKDETLNVTGLDPTVGGATFYLVSPSSGQQSSTFQMPAGDWSSKNGKYSYADKDLVNGPVKKAKLKNGLLRLVLKGSAINFPVLGVRRPRASSRRFAPKRPTSAHSSTRAFRTGRLTVARVR
jgi:hypothetical protein